MEQSHSEAHALHPAGHKQELKLILWEESHNPCALASMQNSGTTSFSLKATGLIDPDLDAHTVYHCHLLFIPCLSAIVGGDKDCHYFGCDAWV